MVGDIGDKEMKRVVILFALLPLILGCSPVVDDTAIPKQIVDVPVEQYTDTTVEDIAVHIVPYTTTTVEDIADYIVPFTATTPIVKFGGLSITELYEIGAFDLRTGMSTDKGRELGLPERMFLETGLGINAIETWDKYIPSLTPEAKKCLAPIDCDNDPICECKVAREIVYRGWNFECVERECHRMMSDYGVYNCVCVEMGWVLSAYKLKELYPWITEGIIEQIKLFGPPTGSISPRFPPCN